MKHNAASCFQAAPLGRSELGLNITQKVAILQMKIIPTAGGKDKMKP
jgi:hypothetical protein